MAAQTTDSAEDAGSTGLQTIMAIIVVVAIVFTTVSVGIALALVL